jgi:hypothetical protein
LHDAGYIKNEKLELDARSARAADFNHGKMG